MRPAPASCLPLGFVRDGLERMSGRTSSRGVTRSTIMSPDDRPCTEIRLGTLRMASFDLLRSSSSRCISGGAAYTV
jgi:hypothetical protein